jgi:hypothetical protein
MKGSTMTDSLQWIDDLIKALPKAAERTPEEVARAEAFIAQLFYELSCENPENFTRI